MSYERELLDDELELFDEVVTYGGDEKIVLHPMLGYGRTISSQPIVREDGLVDREIIPPDERKWVPNTLAVPYRWVCCLDLYFPDPDKPSQLQLFRGTGTLISPRHILTAGHNLYNEIEGSDKIRRALLEVRYVIATPGRNGAAASAPARTPLGAAFAVAARTSRRWRSSTTLAQLNSNREYDYGLITLNKPIGEQRFAALGNRPLGYWGSRTYGVGTRIRPRLASVLRNKKVNISGYPGDKCGNQPPVGSATVAQIRSCPTWKWASAQFRAYNRVSTALPASSPGLVFYQLDTYGGHSGSPVWLRWQRYRNLVAIHVARDDPNVPGVANRGVRITTAIMNDVRSWMRIAPSFPSVAGRPNLRRGSRGTAVRDLQKLLNVWIDASPNARLSRLAIDGIFGVLTDGAVRKFQADMQIKVDGIVGPVTWSRLALLPPLP